MNKILDMAHPSTTFRDGLDGRLSPLELALGWPDGLHRLLEYGFKSRTAVGLSMQTEDLDSVRSLLTVEQFSERDRNGYDSPWPIVFASISRDTSQEMIEIIVEALVHSRQGLAELAAEEIPGDELEMLGFFREKVLDVSAQAVYERLLETASNVPLKFNPGEEYNCSVYLEVLRYHKVRPVLLESLFKSGFHSVDALNTDGHTPLQKLCIVGRECYTGGRCSDLPAINWFLDKGASPTFYTRQNGQSNILHCLAKVYAAIPSQHYRSSSTTGYVFTDYHKTQQVHVNLLE